MHTEPSKELLATLLARTDDGPIIALNLNRYRESADYPAGTPEAEVSGREAYARYGVVAIEAIAQTGGKILWSADAQDVVIGCEHERYDEVVAVWYPSRAAFMKLPEHPGYLEAMDLHRRAAIEHASLIFFKADAEPRLTSPLEG